MYSSDNKLTLPTGGKRELHVFFKILFLVYWFFYNKLLNINFNTIVLFNIINNGIDFYIL